METTEENQVFPDVVVKNEDDFDEEMICDVEKIKEEPNLPSFDEVVPTLEDNKLLEDVVEKRVKELIEETVAMNNEETVAMNDVEKIIEEVPVKRESTPEAKVEEIPIKAPVSIVPAILEPITKDIELPKAQKESIIEKEDEELQSDSKSLHCYRCKATQSWLWKKSTSGAFICTTCDIREQDGEDMVPTPRRTHRDSLVVHEGDHTDSLDSKPAADAGGKCDPALEIDSVSITDQTASTPLPTRKSSRSTRSTISNSNPYAYPRPVMSKPKEKKSVVKTAPSYLCPAPILSLAHQVRYKGTYVKMGDIVSVRGHDGGIYYAQIRGLLEDQYCEKSAALTWLLPTQQSPPPEKGFDPDTYIIGMEEDVPRSLDCMEFVMHAPSDYFKIRQPFGFADTYGLDESSLVM